MLTMIGTETKKHLIEAKRYIIFGYDEGAVLGGGSDIIDESDTFSSAEAKVRANHLKGDKFSIYEIYDTVSKELTVFKDTD